MLFKIKDFISKIQMNILTKKIQWYNIIVKPCIQERKKIMKKIISMFLAAMMLFAFASCGENSDVSSGGDASSGSSASSNADTSSDSAEPPTVDKTYAPQGNGIGNTTIGGIEIKDQNGDGVIHIGCIGDSITAGNPGKCYPDYLQEYLNELSKIDGNTYVVHNNGKGGAGVGHTEEEVGDPNWGWGTVIDEDEDGKAFFYYDDRAYRSAFDYVHDVTIVQMGTNNWASNNRDEYFAEDYYNYLIKPFQEMGSQVIISTPPYAEQEMYSVINGAIHDEVVQMAWDLNLPIIDMNRLMYGMDEVYDGIHPFPAGYSVMALIFYEHIFGGEPSTVSVTAQPGTKITFIDGQGRSYNRNVPESGKLDMVLSPAEVTYNVIAECEGYLTYRETVTVKGDMEFKPEQKAAKNVALSGTAFACDSPVYQGENDANDADKIIDGELTAGGYQPEAYKSGDYVGVEFANTSVATINIYWETAAYISEFSKNGFNVDFKINGEWKKQTADELNVVRESYTDDIVCDVIKLNTPTEIEGVKITFLDGDISDHKFAPKLYELEVFAG